MGKDCTGESNTHNLCTPNYTGVTATSVGFVDNETDPIYDTFIAAFCTQKGSNGDQYRSEVCQRVGNYSNEWNSESDNGVDCKYDSCTKYTARKTTDCCNNCCGKGGRGVICKRTAYNGNPVACCLRDYGGCNLAFDTKNSSSDNNCFSSPVPGKNCKDFTTDCGGTCDPCLRDVTSDSKTYYDKGYNNAGELTRYFVCGNYGLGYSDNHTEQKTGSSITQTPTYCQNTIYDYCTGADLPVGNSSWIERWMQSDGTVTPQSCIYAFARNLFYIDEENYTPPDSSIVADTCSLVQGYIATLKTNTGEFCTPYTTFFRGPKFMEASNLVSGAMSRYVSDGFQIGALPGSKGYNPFQDFMYKSIFCPFPGVSEEALLTVCKPYNSSQLSINPGLSDICGCFLPNAEYQEYFNTYQINLECTPTCNRPQSVKRTNYFGDPILCSQDVCIIDNVAVNLAESQVGEIDISQVCSSCGDSSDGTVTYGNNCNCTFAYNTYTVNDSELQRLNIDQQCATSNCTIYNYATNTYETVPCSEAPNRLNAINQEQKQLDDLHREAVIRRNRNILLFLGFLLFLILLVWIFLRIAYPSPSQRKSKKSTKSKRNELSM